MEFHLPLIAKNAVYFFSKILHRTLGTLCVLSKIVLQRSLKQLPYWLATLSADSAISICCRSKKYGDGTKALAGLIQEDKFELSAPTACHLHNYVGKEDALEWGVIRSKDVSLHNISFVPPTNDLEKIIQNGFNFLQHEVANPVERAIGVFLFMARNQPFYDANERTASLMMNGCLMVNGYFPITVLNQNSEEFHRELGLFYESGNANDMFRFFQKTIQELYSKEQYESFSANNK